MYPGSRSLDAGYAQTGVGGFGFPSSGCPVTLRVLNPDQMERGVGAQFFRGGLVKRKKKGKKNLAKSEGGGQECETKCSKQFAYGRCSTLGGGEKGR